MESLEKKLQYSFSRRELLEEALNHSSYANEHRSAGISSNERLEFLGDSVLGFVTAEFLFKTYPRLPEGDLTRMRASLDRWAGRAWSRCSISASSRQGRSTTSEVLDRTPAIPHSLP